MPKSAGGPSRWYLSDILLLPKIMITDWNYYRVDAAAAGDKNFDDADDINDCFSTLNINLVNHFLGRVHLLW